MSRIDSCTAASPRSRGSSRGSKSVRVAKKWPLTSRPESPHAGKFATGYALRDFPRAHQPSSAMRKENVRTSYLLHLSTTADSKISDQPWVKFQSAGWVNIQSAPTLCLTLGELAEIEAAAKMSAGRLTVGFNRRFAPQVQRVKALLAGVGGPKAFVMTVNAGAIPAEHWTQDSEIGGGRVIGEACHFIDLLRFLAGAPIVEWRRMDMAAATNDTLSLQLSFEDGSIGTVHYFANGPKSFPKERLEVFAGGRVLQLDNFRKLTGFGWPGFSKMNLWRQDKGQKACAVAFVRAVETGGPAPIPLEELIEVARVTIEAAGG